MDDTSASKSEGAVSHAAGEDLRRHAGGLLEETRDGSPQDLPLLPESIEDPKSIEINNTPAHSFRTAMKQTSYMPKGFFTQGAFTR